MEEHPIDLHHRRETSKEHSQRNVSIDILPDDALLEIFTSLREISQSDDYDYDLSWSKAKEWWIPLVHTCQRWRCLIFASPFHLRLELACESPSSVGKWESLDIWPPIPISIYYHSTESGGYENAIAALQHRDRVSEIAFDFAPDFKVDIVAGVMQESFPALISLSLCSFKLGVQQTIPDTFLGGSAPSLRTLTLSFVIFPGLPRLLLSAPRLVSLTLADMPIQWWISSEAMATCLAALVELESLDIEVYPTSSHPYHTSPPSLPRAAVPALIDFSFLGPSEYLEDLVARIDCPKLQTVSLMFGEEHLIFPMPQFYRFVSSTERFELPNRASLGFSFGRASLQLGPFKLDITCQQDSDLKLICLEPSPFLSRVDCLDLDEPIGMPVTSATKWLEFFGPFIAVQSLRVSRGVWQSVVHTLRGLNGENATEVLPCLRTIVFGESQPYAYRITAALEPFIATRQASGHPVAIHVVPWEYQEL